MTTHGTVQYGADLPGEAEGLEVEGAAPFRPRKPDVLAIQGETLLGRPILAIGGIDRDRLDRRRNTVPVDPNRAAPDANFVLRGESGI